MTAFLIILLTLIVLYIIASYLVFHIAVVRTKPSDSRATASALSRFQNQIDDGLDWIREKNCEKIEITSYDGLRLTARFLPAENPRGTLILMHGYRSGLFRDFACVYSYYHSLGFNMLIPSQRAHGESEGEYICFGSKERYDCKAWSDYASRAYGPDNDIFLDGISMGASTVLMASNLDLPENVRGIIADSGFTSAWDEIAYLLKRHAHLPAHPFLDGANIICRLIAGFAFDECSARDCLKETKLPILFIHGESDNYVPCKFSRENFAACASPKEILTVKDAGHGLSYLVDRDACTRALTLFIERYSSCEK